MAIIFHSEEYSKIKIDSHIIIGITGYNYQSFLDKLAGEDIYYLKKCYINNEITILNAIATVNDKKLDEYLHDLGLNKDFFNKKDSNLSHSEKRLLNYLHMLISNQDIIIIDEPFLDLDYDAKKRIITLFKKLSKKKTIIIGSCDTDIIYTQCKKVLLLGKKKCLYDDVSVLSNKRVLKQYHITMPEIVEFVRLAKEKHIKLPYSQDIRDLIKDVYRNVSK